MSFPSTTPELTSTPAWEKLQHLALALEESTQTIAGLFASDGKRAGNFSLEAAGIFMDYSKHLLTAEVHTALVELAATAGMEQAIDAMFAGEEINNTEHRAVLHVALRSPGKSSGEEQQVHAALDRMEVFADKVISGDWKGHTGKAITDIVNIGIGGSDLGPAMAYEALAPFHVPHLQCHFVSNVDPVHLEQTLAKLDPSTTLFIIASKTFTTLETMLNAKAARQWILASGVPESGLAGHFAGVSANVSKAAEFGIATDNIFPMWDWVGGRYSLWSSIGLSIALGCGMANFRALLSGAHAMDEHFRTAPLKANMPVLMALLALWYHNFWQAESVVILPYAQNLHLFPAFLQQLDMESLGKQVRRDSSPMTVVSGGIVWGSAGTNGQHSFHQLLHQGTHLIPADFIAVKCSASHNREMQENLLANCFAQSQALMDGKDLQQAMAELLTQGMDEEAAAFLAPHRVVPGNRPSTTFMLDRLTPHSLGALTALYEHRVYAHSVLLGLNAFDQWGVELGKVLGNGIYKAITASTNCTAFDSSTNALVNRARNKTG
jgi:glucose-6-phosphate isomerase